MKSNIKTAMVLAAGRGERLRPITDILPKALCTVNGKPLIEHHIQRLVESGFERIIINHAYLGGQIRQFLGNGSRYGVNIMYSPEPPGGLETGGGLFEARDLLGNEPFLSVNADIFTDFDYKLQFNFDDALATLVLVPTSLYRTVGDYDLTSDNYVKNKPNNYTYSGIAIYQPSIFDYCSTGRYSITPLVRQLADKGKIRGVLHHGIFDDIGTLEQYHRYHHC